MMVRPPHMFSNTQRLGVVRRCVAAAIIAAAWLTSPAPHALGQSRATAAASVVLHDLPGVATLRSDFNRDRSKVRIVLLLSPT
jgi:hypothetical protein